MSHSKLDWKNMLSYATDKILTGVLIKRKVNVMMGFPEKLKIGLLGRGGEYVNIRKWKK